MKNKLLHLLNDLFLLVFFLLMLIAVKPELIYHFQQLGFTTSKIFFSEYASYPGGLAEYISLFLFQFSNKAIWGSIVITIVSSVILTITGALLDKDSVINGLLKYIPVLFLGILLTDYSLPPFFPVMVMFLFIFFFIFKLIVDGKLSEIIHFVFLAAMFSIAYYVIGGFAFMVLIFTSLIYLLLAKRKGIVFSSVLILVLGVVLPWLGQKLFFINIEDAYFKLVPYFSKYKPVFLLYSLIFSLPLILLVQQLFAFLFNKNNNPGNPGIASQWVQSVQVILMIFVLMIGMLLHIETKEKFKIKVDYLAYNKKWDELLALVEKKKSDDRLVQFQTTRALYHKGVLTETLFDYPQFWGVDGLFLTRYFADEILLPTTDLFFDLGYINEAIHYGNEAVSQFEYSPQIIEQLILSNLVANKIGAVSIYINELKNFPVYKKKAEGYERYLNGQGSAELNNLVIQKRELMPFNDFKVNIKSPQYDMMYLLDDRPHNKMAYEYLMVYFLLNNDLSSFVKYYSAGKKFNYKNIPKIFQEAIILYAYDMKRQGKPTGNIFITKEIGNLFNNYLLELKKYGGNLEKARPDLEKMFGNTYWFYVNYTSPVTNKRKIVLE